MIDLQSQLIKNKDQELTSVQETVQNEVRSYASIVENTCATALAPRVIQTAVKKANVSDMPDRNLIFHGIQEEEGEDLKEKVGAVFSHLKEKPLFTTPCRLGVGAAGTSKVRPVKVTLSSYDVVIKILKKAKDLKDSSELSSVYLSRDITFEERAERRKLVGELKEKKQKNPGKTFIIKKNAVICLSVDN